MTYGYPFSIFKLFMNGDKKIRSTWSHSISRFLPLRCFSLVFISVGFYFHAFESIWRYYSYFPQVYTTEILICLCINLKHHQTVFCVWLMHFIVNVWITTRRGKINKLHRFLNERYITSQSTKKNNPPAGFCCIRFSTIISLAEWMYLISILLNRNWSLSSNPQE